LSNVILAIDTVPEPPDSVGTTANTERWESHTYWRRPMWQ
jgi:hypothetical protein